jgi:peptidoglycan/LPS O-acetylase OafA/YrhL
LFQSRHILIRMTSLLYCIQMHYYPKINGLRFIAIFLVLLEHFAWFIGKHLTAGYYGVDLFFVISGFLVTNILLRENQKSFKENYLNFLGRRILRIFPIYYLTIFILWLIGLDAVKENLTSLLTYTYNYAIVRKHLDISPVFHFWSLSVEEQFYLLWPFVIIPLRKHPFLLFGFIFTVVLVGYSQQMFSIFPSLSEYNYFSLFTRMASLGLGALGSLLATHELLPIRFFRNKSFENLILFLLVFTLFVDYKFKFLILPLCSLYLILKASFCDFSNKPFNKFLTNKYIMYIGTISYGIYIFHLPIAAYFDQLIFNRFWLSIDFKSFGMFSKLEWHPWIIKFPLYSLLSIVVATLSFKYIETPILKLKDRFFKY